MKALSLLAFRKVKGFEHKKCPFCHSNSVKKNGKRHGKQRYKCQSCSTYFDGGIRLNNDELWRQYRDENRTVKQLAQLHSCSTKTIQRRLQQAQKQNHFTIHKSVNVILDTTYFKRSFGVMVLLDSLSGQVLSVTIVNYETNQLYWNAVQKVRDKNTNIQSIICDGRRGLPQLFVGIPVQLCQFHQIKTVIRYLTNKPKSLPAQQLRELTLTLCHSTHDEFQAALNAWFLQHQTYVNERTTNPETGKSRYTHKRLRSAYLSLKRNLPFLFTFEKYPDLDIPNTTNLLESRFSELKAALRCHRGLNQEHKIQFILDYFSN